MYSAFTDNVSFQQYIFFTNIRNFILFQQNKIRRPCVPCNFIVHYIFCHGFQVCLSHDQEAAVPWIVAP